jgi:hypothetical protein
MCVEIWTFIDNVGNWRERTAGRVRSSVMLWSVTACGGIGEGTVWRCGSGSERLWRETE